MTNALAVFHQGIEGTKASMALYDHLTNVLHIPHDDVSDILRQQIVSSVSAFDRLLHELIRMGIVEMFNGTRTRTPKFMATPFTSETVLKAVEYSSPGFTPSSSQETAEYVISKEVSKKLSYLSFQSPEKVKDGLSYIWDDNYKMQVLAIDISMSGTTNNEKQKALEQQLTLIVDRRNQIAHEGDIDPITSSKRNITRVDVVNTVDFIEKLGDSIHKFVTGASCYVSH